jgi:hypothetical protein
MKSDLLPKNGPDTEKRRRPAVLGHALRSTVDTAMVL